MHSPRARRAFALILALILALPFCPAGSQAQGRDRATVARAVDSVAASYLKDGRLAGMSVAVVRGRDTLVMKGYGFADLELDVPTPARAVYEIGSVTKQFTAAAILQLAEAGKLSLDDEITKYLPDYPTQNHRVTIRRLLDHTSGIKGYTEIPKFGTLMMRKLPKDSLVALFKDEKFEFAPGEAMVYNNSAYFLAGLIIEKLSGMSYADYVKQNLFDKAGMPDSRYCSESAIIKRKAHGYDMGSAGLQNKGFIDHTYPFSAGSLCSTVGDLVAWNRALHGGKVLSASAYKELTTPATLNDGTPLRYTKGLTIHTIAGHRVIEHGGGINGYFSSSNYFPDDDLIVVVLLNSAGPVAVDAVVKSVVEVTLGRSAPKSVAYTGDLSALAGTYTGIGRGRAMSMRVTAEGSKLTAVAGERPAELCYIGNDVWESDDMRLTFVRQGNKVTKLRADMVYGYTILDRQP